MSWWIMRGQVAWAEIDDPCPLPVLFETLVDVDWQDEQVWYWVASGLRHGFPDIGGPAANAPVRPRTVRPTESRSVSFT